MANIAIYMLPERGHLNPSFKIARTLKSHGHRVYYLQLPEFEEYIHSQELEFAPLFEKYFPIGYEFDYRLSTIENIVSRIRVEADAAGIDWREMLRRELISKLERINAHLLVQDVYTYSGESSSIIKTPRLLLNPTIVYPSHLRSPTLILCPEKFDYLRPDNTGHLHYVEPSVDLQRIDKKFEWNRVREDKQLIYCSLGTQSHWSYGTASHDSNQRNRRAFLQSIINIMADRPGSQLILSIGSNQSAQDFYSVPPNVHFVDGNSQLEILGRTSLAITHGGLNTIKESIIFGVPMIVFPLVGDQFKNADCVIHHQLGLRGDIENSSEGLIHSLIGEIDSNPLYRAKVEIMKEEFRKADDDGRATAIIENALISRSDNFPPDSNIEAHD